MKRRRPGYVRKTVACQTRDPTFLHSTAMSFLRIAQHNTARRLAFQLPILARAQSTSAPQTGVDVVEKQSTEVTTTIPPKEAITADVISGAPGMVFLHFQNS